MALIQIKDLSFSYPGADAPIFDHVDLDLDTGWRLGLIGRNGRGKTTFLNILLGKLEYTGEISSPEPYEYFPMRVDAAGQTAMEAAKSLVAPFAQWEARMTALAGEATPQAMQAYGEVEQAYSAADGYVIDELIKAETGRLGITPEALEQPYEILSGGERVKLLLAAAFLKKHHFLLIDEPTDHLDAEGRARVARWLAGKSGFILVSHDRAFLDAAIDHVLSINRADIELQRGNYSSWRHNRAMQDEFELAENKKLSGEISRLHKAVEQTGRWSDKIEKSKTAGNQTYNRGTASVDRGYIGHQAARMMQRSKAIERRKTKDIEDKQKLLKNIETAEPLVFHVLKADKARLVSAEALSIAYDDREIVRDLSFSIDEGERVALLGANGSGKSSVLKVITGENTQYAGKLAKLSSLVMSVLPQDTDFLGGSLKEFALSIGIDESLFKTLLRKLDFERALFEREISSYSAGQKKKVCLAASLAKPAHLFVWDEPLNYIDVLSREQIEEAILHSMPTLIFVEHDAFFCDKVATKSIQI